MNYITLIQNSLDYIEANLKTELRTDELASTLGFSLYHYSRIFQSAVGRSVKDYITKRRLTHAIYEISLGGKMIEVSLSLSYGFNTYAGFYKALKKEYGVSPKEYMQTRVIRKPVPINLIQEEHIMISKKNLEEVLLQWDITTPTIADIYINATKDRSENTWLINDDMVLKIGTNMKGLTNHILISKLMVKNGLCAATPILTLDGKDYYTDGDLYYFLSKKLAGKSIKGADFYNDNYKEQAFYHGEIIGKLHTVLAELNNDVLCNEANIYETVTNWAIPKTNEVFSLSPSFINDYKNTMAKLIKSLPKQIIHRDPNPDNILFQDNKLVGFIDFEITEVNVRIFDPCYAATAILSDSFHEIDNMGRKRWTDIFQNIVAGYDSIAHLNEEEIEAIPYVIYSIQLIFIAYCEGIDKLKELSITNQKMFRWLLENKEILELKNILNH